MEPGRSYATNRKGGKSLIISGTKIGGTPPRQANIVKKLLLGVGRIDPAEFDLSFTGIDTIFCKVEAAVINRFVENVFYAKLLLAQNDGKAVEVNCVPAKAVAHGIRTEAPIFTDETVLDKAGITIGA